MKTVKSLLIGSAIVASSLVMGASYAETKCDANGCTFDSIGSTAKYFYCDYTVAPQSVSLVRDSNTVVTGFHNGAMTLTKGGQADVSQLKGYCFAIKSKNSSSVNGKVTVTFSGGSGGICKLGQRGPVFGGGFGTDGGSDSATSVPTISSLFGGK